MEEIPAGIALGGAAHILSSWPQRRCVEAVLALDMGGHLGFTASVGDLQAHTAIPWIFWFLDHPEGYGFPESCHPDWTLAFCWDKAVSLEISRKGPVPVAHLPLASDPALFYPGGCRGHGDGLEGVFVGSTRHANPFLERAAEGCPGLLEAAKELWNYHRNHMDIPMEEAAWQLVFATQAGSHLQVDSDPLWRLWVKSCLHLAGQMKRVELAEEVIGPRGAVFGDPAWKNLLRKAPYLGPVKYGPGLRDVYLRSSFVLEVRQPQSRGGLSQRVFDASLCGRPVLAEWSSELEELFGGYERVWVFRSLEEALEAKKRCLHSPAEASKMAFSARKEILSGHTFLHRACFLLESLKKRLS